MKIALLGIGTVGTGVREQLDKLPDISVKKILVRRDRPDLAGLATRNYDEILADPEIDVVVEVMGGIHPAYDYVLGALKAGKHVVTANKLLLSYHLDELLQAAEENGVELKFDASVGGGIPYLFNLMRSGRGDCIRSLSGICNGTTNLILDTMQSEGTDFADVLAQAQRAGFAEADPSADIDGIDARSKLCVASSVAYGTCLHPDHVATAGIRFITGYDVQVFRKLGLVCRLLVRSERHDDDTVSACVEPTLLKPTEPESGVHRCDNLISLVGCYSGRQSFFGQGAGKEPTALSVVMGLMDIRDGSRPMAGRIPSGQAAVDNSRLAHRYYVRTTESLPVAAEKVSADGDFICYITEPLPVDRMHALANSLRNQDPALFFAGIQE